MDSSIPTAERPAPDPEYDFHRCKLCGEWTASPLYRLGERTIYACSKCDFHTLDFLDTLSENDARDSKGGLDRKSREYIEERLSAHDLLPQLRLNLVREHCALFGAHFLDIGAGVGQFLLLLAGEGASARGLEPSRIRREFAALKYGLSLNPETIEGFRLHGEYADFFDVVTLWDVIEHVNFPVETVAAALYVLKPGGLLFIDTPSRDAAPYRLSQRAYRLSGGKISLFFENFYSSIPFGHKQIFRPAQLVRLARQAGLQVVSLKSGYATGACLSSFLRPRNRIVLICRRPFSLAGRPPIGHFNAIP